MKTQNVNNKPLIVALIIPLLFLTLMVTQFPDNSSKSITMAAIGAPYELEPLTVPEYNFRDLKPEIDASAELSLVDELIQRQSDSQVVKDTIDREAFKKQKLEMEKAMEKLESTNEWKEMQALSQEMARMSKEMMEDLEPLINEEISRSVEMSKIQIEELHNSIREIQEVMEPLEVEKIQRQIEEVMAVQEVEMRARLEAVQEQMADIRIEEFKLQAELAREMAEKVRMNEEEIESLAKEAELMAKEAESYAKVVTEFHDKTVNMLIKDGYIKSKDDIEELDIENGVITINGQELKSKHQKKYLDLYNEYFTDEEFHFNHN